MAVYKDIERGTWYVRVKYRDWTGQKKEAKKRGFKTRREAVAWEESFRDRSSGAPDMLFGSLVDLYFADMENRLKGSTMDTKRNVMYNHVLPYFKGRKVNEITAPDVRQWQNTITEKGFSQTYLKEINNQFSAVMNYACRFYQLQENPVRTAGTMGHAHTDEEMRIWTRDQFDRFIGTVEEPSYHLLYTLLFWTGIRVGEALVLCPDDLIELQSEDGRKRRILRITKTYYRKDGVTAYNTPKTKCSRRDVTISDFVWDEAWDYINRLYDWEPDERIFWFEKSGVNRHFKRHCDKAGLEPIRIHDLRHSHASMLINMGKPILEISRRLGHKSVQTTLDTYAHLYPDKDVDLAEALDEYRQTKEQTPEEKRADAKSALADLSASELAALLAELIARGG